MTSYIRHPTLVLPSGVGVKVWTNPVPADAEWHFMLGATNGIVDQSGNGHVLTAVGNPSWVANGIQFGNNTAGFSTDLAEIASLTRIVIAAMPAGAGADTNQARFFGTFAGSATARTGSSVGLQTTAVGASLPTGQEGYAGYVALNATTLASFGTVNYGPLSRKTTLRFMALSIDAVAGTLTKFMPKFDQSTPQAVSVTGLATRPLNGNDRIGAWSNPGDASGLGAYQIAHAARWNRALAPAELMAEYVRLRSLYGDI